MDPRGAAEVIHAASIPVSPVQEAIEVASVDSVAKPEPPGAVCDVVVHFAPFPAHVPHSLRCRSARFPTKPLLKLLAEPRQCYACTCGPVSEKGLGEIAFGYCRT